VQLDPSLPVLLGKTILTQPPRHSSRFFIDLPARFVLAGLIVVWSAVVLGGGSARADVLLVVAVRFLAIVGIGVVLIFGRPERLATVRKPLFFIALLALVVALQLIPLPPGLWNALPGRAPYADLASVPELDGIWRPFSLAPDMTWNALLSLLPPLFFLVAVPMLSARFRRWLLIGLLCTILLSAMLGLLQYAGGAQSNLRWYPITNVDAATGFFANRNHEATFLAMGIPLAVWWALSGKSSRRLVPRLTIAASMVGFLLVAAATSQSRMGLITVAISLLFTGLYFLRQVKLKKRLFLWLGAAALVGAAGVTLAVTTWAPGRMSVTNVENDLRIQILPESLEAAKTFFPAGAGYGAFPTVFPRFESNEDLSPEYVNHTHSELTQIVIEGGIVSVLLLLLYLGWFAVASIRVWRDRQGHPDEIAEARLCTILILLPLAASVTDYPIRTPLMACALAIVSVMLSQSLRGLSAPVRARPARI
jgi:O-antigen ligase